MEEWRERERERESERERKRDVKLFNGRRVRARGRRIKENCEEGQSPTRGKKEEGYPQNNKNFIQLFFAFLSCVKYQYISNPPILIDVLANCEHEISFILQYPSFLCRTGISSRH